MFDTIFLSGGKNRQVNGIIFVGLEYLLNKQLCFPPLSLSQDVRNSLKLISSDLRTGLYFSTSSYLVLDTTSFSSKLAAAALRGCNRSLRIYFKTISLNILSSDLLNAET